MLGNKWDVKVRITIITLAHHLHSQAYQVVMDDIHYHERPQRVLTMTLNAILIRDDWVGGHLIDVL